MGGVRAFNLVVSNVPGPQQPVLPQRPPAARGLPGRPAQPGQPGLTVGVLSYDGGVLFGLLADRDLDPGVDALAGHLRASLDEVLALAG